MTYKDFYNVLKQIDNNESLGFNKLANSKYSLTDTEIKSIINKAYTLIELRQKQLIRDGEVRFTLGGIPVLQNAPKITVDGYEFLKNYKGTFKNRCISCVKNIWFLILFFFSLTGSFWALINILSYFNIIKKP